jgi:hypothetical protein
MPTITDHLQDFLKFFFSQPEIAERLKPYDAALEKVRAFGFEIVRRVQETPPSPGYESWLVAHGVHPLFGRTLAGLTVRSGNRVAKDRARLPTVASAIKFLASPGHHHGSISRRVAVLLAAWKETSVVETIFDTAGLDVFEFVRLLESYSAGNETEYPRLREIAASLAPHLPVRRGPKISAASAAHEFFLKNVVAELETRHAYTWDAYQGKCTDSATEATRREFSRPSFDPRPAYRRSKDH